MARKADRKEGKQTEDKKHGNTWDKLIEQSTKKGARWVRKWSCFVMLNSRHIPYLNPHIFPPPYPPLSHIPTTFCFWRTKRFCFCKNKTFCFVRRGHALFVWRGQSVFVSLRHPSFLRIGHCAYAGIGYRVFVRIRSYTVLRTRHSACIRICCHVFEIFKDSY